MSELSAESKVHVYLFIKHVLKNTCFEHGTNCYSFCLEGVFVVWDKLFGLKHFDKHFYWFVNRTFQLKM